MANNLAYRRRTEIAALRKRPVCYGRKLSRPSEKALGAILRQDGKFTFSEAAKSLGGRMALQPLRLRPGPVSRTTAIPEVLMPLVEAAERGIDLVPIVKKVIGNFGFDSFLYGVSTCPRPDKEAQLFAFTTLPMEWLGIYDRKAYIEVDPRVDAAYNSTMPTIWDQRTFRGKSERVDQFLDDAATFGICSGLAFVLHDVNHHGIMLAFNSCQPEIDPVRRRAIERDRGSLLLFGHSFNELFMKTVVERGLPSRIKGAPLSPRERQVLRLLAAGQTTDDVARQMGITSRTVQFHLGSLRTKLDAATREEAVALAVKAGIIALNY